ncbi:hypothetical protein [Pseudomonas asplenii]|uniref:hypothetical protein n=1 Tax=Pseudomonas asplenii TaxID=53407 RepID=UPI0003744E42|nr:hypothetical protein [Pseudomonas fuscovaginae]
MTEVHRYNVVKMLSEGGNRISYDPHGPEVVMAEAYDQLKVENEALRAMAGEIYQVLGSLDAPENALDQVSAAANGLRLPHKTVLPFLPDEHEALRKDAERYRGVRRAANRQGFTDEQFDQQTDTRIASFDAAMAKEASHG